jgi:hypothetical protein
MATTKLSTTIAGIVAGATGATGPTGPAGATGASGATTTISNGTSNLNIASSGGAIYANTAGTNAITVDTSQNVGIGITNPTRKLQVKGGTIGVTSADGTVTNAMDYNSIGTATNSSFQIVTNATDRITIDSSGNVLFGTSTSNGAKFAVNTVPNTTIGQQSAFISGAKTIYASVTQLPQNQLFVYDNTSGTAAGSGGAISFGGDAGGGQATWYAAIEARKNNSTSGDYGAAMVFYTRPSGSTAGERGRFDSSGNFLVNTTTAYGGVVAGGSKGFASESYLGGNSTLSNVAWQSGAYGGSRSTCTIDVQFPGAGSFLYEVHASSTTNQAWQIGGGYTNGTQNFSHNTSAGSNWTVTTPSNGLVRLVNTSAMGIHPTCFIRVVWGLSSGFSASNISITFT